MNILIVGSNGGIASEVGAAFGHDATIYTISRGDAPNWSALHLKIDSAAPHSVAPIRNWLGGLPVLPNIVIHCAGLLHTQHVMPERRLAELSMATLSELLSVNLAAHVHVAQALDPLITRKHAIKWLSLSAMVGSTSDNRLGGWYSYRMSKAALNMFIRNLSIEWGRRSPNSIVAALHPGTTDTALSLPFQKNIAGDRLYSAATTASRIIKIVETLTQHHHGQLLHWDGSVISP